MGAQQVSRVALGLALVLACEVSAWAQTAEPVVIVDLRPGTADSRRSARELFASKLGDADGVQLLTDRVLARALAAEPAPAVGAEARKTSAQRISELLVLQSSNDCSGWQKVDASAISLLAGLEAAGRRVQPELKLAYAYSLACAHRYKRSSQAALAAARLRVLGQTVAPDGVEATTWTAYSAPTEPTEPTEPTAPEVELRIEGKPAGAEIWADHVRLGRAPLTTRLSPGRHLLGVSHETGVTGMYVDVTPADTVVHYRIDVVPDRWSGARTTVAAWRSGLTSANALEIAKLLKLVGVRFAVLLTQSGRAELWTLAANANAARRLQAGVMRVPGALADTLVRESRHLSGKPGTADVQILGEPGKKKESRKPLKWWVYASIIGAVAVGASLVIASDLAEDRQRFELSWP